MNKLLFFSFFVFLFVSCTENQTTKNLHQSPDIENSVEAQKSVALKFINDYVENANLMGKAIETRKWVAQNTLVTESFKKTVTTMIDEAEKDDPELGLGFDPIFDAQDYPEEGFQAEQIDEKTNLVTVSGKKWNDFKLKIKLILINGNWLVDGAGAVNISSKERINR